MAPPIYSPVRPLPLPFISLMILLYHLTSKTGTLPPHLLLCINLSNSTVFNHFITGPRTTSPGATVGPYGATLTTDAHPASRRRLLPHRNFHRQLLIAFPSVSSPNVKINFVRATEEPYFFVIPLPILITLCRACNLT
jgi:hypothetical protein